MDDKQYDDDFGESYLNNSKTSIDEEGIKISFDIQIDSANDKIGRVAAIVMMTAINIGSANLIPLLK